MVYQMTYLTSFLLVQVLAAAAWVTGSSKSLNRSRGHPLQATNQCSSSGTFFTGRRGFLAQTLVLGTTAAAPMVAIAEESEIEPEISRKAQNDLVTTTKEEVIVASEQPGTAQESVKEPESDKKDEMKPEEKIAVASEQPGTAQQSVKEPESDKKDEMKSEEKIAEAKEEEKQVDRVAEIKEEVKELDNNLESEEKDEIRTEKETEELITQLEQQIDSEEKPTKSQTEETKNLIFQLEKDQEKVEADTLKLMETIQGVVKSEVGAAEATKNGGDTLSKAPVQPTVASGFIDQLKARSEANDDFIAELKQDIKQPDKVNKETFLEQLKERANTNKKFLSRFEDFKNSVMEKESQFEEFESRLLEQYRSSDGDSYSNYLKNEKNKAASKFW